MFKRLESKSFIVLSMGLLLLVGCEQLDTTNTTETPSPTAMQTGAVNTPPTTQLSDETADAQEALLDDVVENPSAYYGRQMMLTGEVEDVLATNAFTLDATGIGPGDELLVVTRTLINTDAFEAQDAMIDGDATVTGMLIEYSPTELENTYDVTIDADLIAEYEGYPVFVASAVSLE